MNPNDTGKPATNGRRPDGRVRRARSDAGAVLVEFALTLPLLAMLLLAIFSGGLAYNQKLQVTHAVREGARFAATIPASQAFTAGTWAENVRDLVVERSLGDLTASEVCVSLVSGSPGTVVAPASDHSTTGAACIAGQTYPVTSSDSGRRVQISASRPAKIELGVFGVMNLTIVSHATAQSEAVL